MEELRFFLVHLRQKFPTLERISIYAMPKNLHQKTRDELTTLNKEGLNMLYIGIETGYVIATIAYATSDHSISLIISCVVKSKQV